MNLKKYSKYAIRFLFLQSVLTLFTTYYFDKFLLPQLNKKIIIVFKSMQI